MKVLWNFIKLNWNKNAPYERKKTRKTKKARKKEEEKCGTHERRRDKMKEERMRKRKGDKHDPIYVILINNDHYLKHWQTSQIQVL